MPVNLLLLFETIEAMKAAATAGGRLGEEKGFNACEIWLEDEGGWLPCRKILK